MTGVLLHLLRSAEELVQFVCGVMSLGDDLLQILVVVLHVILHARAVRFR